MPTEWFDEVHKDVFNVQTDSKPILACDSTFLTFYEPNHVPALNDRGKPLLVNGQQISVQDSLKDPSYGKS